MEIRDVQCTASGPDPTGAVSAGHITLVGCLTTAELDYDSKSDDGLEDVQYFYRKDGRRQVLQVDYRLNTSGKHNVKTGEIIYLLLICEADWGRLYNVIALRQCSGKPGVY